MNTSEVKPQAPRDPWDSCLIGDLETWPLAELLLWLHQTGRTAMVRVGTGLRAGVLFFRSGQLFRCEWGPLAGEDALVALLDAAQGTFQLIQRDIPEARPNIGRPTAEVLFQCAVATDERSRDHAAARAGN